jgi:phosphoribosylanthranilate isomerase
MAEPMIKICGLRDPAMAAQTASLGVDYIGVIFHPASPRHVNIDQAAAIAAAAGKAGATPVAVFVDQTDNEMRTACEITGIDTVQLHGARARAHHHLLPDTYRRIYVGTLSDDGFLRKDDGLRFLDADRDLILIDAVNPDLPRANGRANFRYRLPFRWLLAGGLSPANVADAIHELRPDGVDVSRGVESSSGNKELTLIRQFVGCVRNHEHVA